MRGQNNSFPAPGTDNVHSDSASDLLRSFSGRRRQFEKNIVINKYFFSVIGELLHEHLFLNSRYDV